MNAEDSFSIPPNLLNEDKPLISTDISFCERNENNSNEKIFSKIPSFHKRKTSYWITSIQKQERT